MTDVAKKMVQKMPGRKIVSISGGKDSTAMTIRMVELGYQVDEYVFFDTGWEFPEMYAHLKRLEKYLDITITRLHPKHPFDELLGRYGWPRMVARWCTSRKQDALKKIKCDYDYRGIAIDERHRARQYDKRKIIYPLIEWGWTEPDCLKYSRSHGFDWGGLYDQFKRVSCFCCPLKGIRGARRLFNSQPELWEKMRRMDKTQHKEFCEPYSLTDLDKKFRHEKNQTQLFGAGIF